MRDDLKKATDSYISCRTKIESLYKTVEEKGESFTVAKLQKSYDILTYLGEQLMKDKATTLEIIPSLSADEYDEWYAVMKPYFK